MKALFKSNPGARRLSATALVPELLWEHRRARAAKAHRVSMATAARATQTFLLRTPFRRRQDVSEHRKGLLRCLPCALRNPSLFLFFLYECNPSSAVMRGSSSSSSSAGTSRHAATGGGQVSQQRAGHCSRAEQISSCWYYEVSWAAGHSGMISWEKQILQPYVQPGTHWAEVDSFFPCCCCRCFSLTPPRL